MAQTTLISSISRSTAYPVSVQATADNSCGTLSLIIPNAWSKQMLMELPTINISIFMEDGTKLKSFNINMTTVNNEIKNAQSVDAYSIPIYDIPESFTFSIIPLFDKFALSAHNHNVENGNIEIFNTSSDGIVDTDIEDYSSKIWTTDTQTFNVKIVFDDSNISAGGGSGGGGGGGSITVDTQVLPNSINPVQNRAIYDFVNSSVSTNTAYFIGTFNSVADLEAYSGSVSNNDYAFVIETDSDSNTIYNRYKYNGSTETWEFEYALNNSSFTAAEWETIQSGLTAQDKTNYNNHLSNTNNPHFVTKSQIGLGNVGNFKAVSTVASQGLNDTEKSNARANINAQENLAFDGTYNSSTNKVATQSTVSDSINALDVSSVGGAGKVISAISETNGKISATATTMDTTPTANSTVPVTSGGVAESQAKQDSEIDYTVNTGAKNYCPYNNLTSDSAGTIIDKQPINLPAGTYLLSCSVTASTNSIAVRLLKDGTSLWNKTISNTGGSIVEEITITDNANQITFYTGVANTISNIMIRSAVITDTTFQPYALPNSTITPAAIKAVDEGAKNLIQNNCNSRTVHGVTATTNADGSITVSGSSDYANNFIVLYDLYAGDNATSSFNSHLTLKPGTYINKGTGRSDVKLQVLEYNTSSDYSIISEGDTDTTFTLTKSYFVVRLWIINTANFSTPVTVYPMICNSSDWTVSQKFVPYASTNRELTVENDSQQSEIDYAINTGVKNLVELTPNTYTSGNVSVTINSDGTVSVSLTSGSKANTQFSRGIKNITSLRDRDLILSGCPSGGNYSSGYALYISDDSATKEKDEGSGVLVPKSASVVNSYLALIVRSGTSISGTLTFRPMVRPASITDSTFQPYALSNPIITPALIEQVDSGSKNKLKNLATSQTVGEVVYTVNSDGTVSAYTTATTTASRTLTLTSTNDNCYVNAGDLITGNPNTTLDVAMQYGIGASGNIANYEPDEEYHTIEVSGIIRYCLISIRTGVSIPQSSPLVFRPMICTAADYAVSQKFVPYAPTNKELYEMIQMLQNGEILNIVYGIGKEIPNNSDLDDYKTPGTFYVLNSTNATTIANKPIGGSGFRLIVSFTSATNRQRQEFYKPNNPDIIYIRNIGTDGNWSSWYRFEGTEVT